MTDRERCPTCGQPVGAWKPARVCAKCHQPIRKRHKWHVVDSRIQHRRCDAPDSYGEDYFEMKRREAKASADRCETRVCEAAAVDDITCADDDCDRANGVRPSRQGG